MQFVKYTDELSQSNKSLRFSRNRNPGRHPGWWSWLPIALLIVTVMAVTTLGTRDNPAREVDWLSRLSNEGDAGAQLQLGIAYRDGLYGLTPDARTAFHWLEKAAVNGNAFAEDAVAMAYDKGLGVNRNETLAAQWWNKAIQDGSHEARVHLAESLIRQNRIREATHLLMK